MRRQYQHKASKRQVLFSLVIYIVCLILMTIVEVTYNACDPTSPTVQILARMALWMSVLGLADPVTFARAFEP